MMHDKGLVVVLSGFSGAGKGTIMKHLLEAHPQDYNLSISATTRGMRAGEKVSSLNMPHLMAIHTVLHELTLSS